MTEIWKDIPGYEGLYMASNFGRIKSYPRRTTSGGILIQSKQTSGHLCVNLSKNGKEKTFRVHKLMAGTFIGQCPFGMEVCHNDGNPGNNFISNLRYDTHKNNMKDMKIHGTFNSPPIGIGSNNGNSEANEWQVRIIKKLLIKKELKQRQIAKIFGLSEHIVSRIKLGKTWKHINA